MLFVQYAPWELWYIAAMLDMTQGDLAAAAQEIARLQAELSASRREVADLRETLDELEGSVVVYDRDRRFLFANRAYRALFPYLPPDDVLRQERFEDLLRRSIAAGVVRHPMAVSDPDGFVAMRVASMQRRQRRAAEPQGARPGRETYHPLLDRWFLIRSRRTPRGNDVSLRVDVTGLKRLQQQLETARRAAEASDHMKSQFLASISHELRTPLNAVINFARLLSDQIRGPLGHPDYVSYARDIEDGGRHLLGLIDELLDLARAAAGRLTIHEGVADPAGLLRAVCRVLGPEAAAAGVSLTCDIPQEPPALRGDPVRLRQVLLNLVANAIKFTSPGGSVRLDLTVPADGGMRIQVRDTGVGIAPEDLGRVMQPFEQAHAAAGARRPGVGLGLPLARHLVELHGGCLVLASTPGQGTTAEVSLPADRVLPVAAER